MSIFTFHRYTQLQLQQAHERLRLLCPVMGFQAPIRMHEDDPHDPKKTNKEPEPQAEKPVKPAHGKRHYRLKNH